ncbi:MAG: isoprenoid biosynthesis glyoxalase ElbB [Planctomycetes bacterium]|nr:isoprenoid biosynthesis glyoxalase ElbB [Planctomycetota bacterium]
MNNRVAVVLCGSGRADGSEIHESVSVLIHLSRAGAEYRCFAPDAPQTEVINHATNKIAAGAPTRNMMVEAARISRGEISPLAQLDPAVFDAVIFPGGFGVAKNLCDFATKGAECSVLPDVVRVIKGFHEARKPIGMCCIAPVLAARVLGTRMNGPGCTVTLGSDERTAAAVQTMGSKHAARGVSEAFTDTTNRLVTSPAYMYEAKPHEVFDGIGAMVAGVMALAASKK